MREDGLVRRHIGAYRSLHFDTIALAHLGHFADDGAGLLATVKAAPAAARSRIGDIEGSDRTLAGARERNRELGGTPRNFGAALWEQDVREASLRVRELAVAAGNNRDRPFECRDDTRNIAMKFARLCSGVADADNQQAVALLRFACDRLFAGLFERTHGDINGG